ncbi:uncharacterized protein LOC131439026 [Malaya genurostris]|uniref:uncharacterized protein LOC131439026 n=1 Tax=Malaya genurostris TaxID=325434 RepID=UPI0026F39F69|nr:uncharacterized protein LOC131439026 [Malaya genurostris]
MSVAAGTSKMSKLRSKQTRLRNLMTSFNVIYSFMEEYEDTRHSSELASRLEKLEPLWEKIDEAMTETELADSEEGAAGERYVKDRVEFQNKFFTLKGFLVSKLRDNPEHNGAFPASQLLESTITPTHPHVKLPLISLPKFSGNVEEWLAFRDLFVSLIHFSSDLPDIEKFHYLRSQLEGEALAVISSLPLTQANYNVAWELLVKRYANSKCLKKKQIQNLFECSAIRKESAAELQKLVEAFEKSTKVLDQVVQQGDYKDLLLIHLMCSRLDDKTRRSREEHSSVLEEEGIKDLMEFLLRRIRVLESLPNRQPDTQIPTIKRVHPNKIASHGVFQSIQSKCLSCADTHPLFTCPVFGRLPVMEREKLLRQNSLCRNCFRRGHQAKECTSRFSCRRCKERHHTLVCYKEEKQKVLHGAEKQVKGAVDQLQVDKASTSKVSEGSSVSSNIARYGSKVLLATAVVRAVDDYGHEFLARALLDSGSECNIISTHLAQKLHVKRYKTDIEISGIGQAPVKTTEKVRVTITSRLSSYSQNMELYVLNKVTEDLPTSAISVSNWESPVGVQLADPEFFRTHPIDLLLGGEFFFDFFPKKQQVSLGLNMPTLVDSVFGWLITGRCA